MLYHYKKDFEKIAMGLMSYAPDLKQTSHLMDELKLYESDDDRHLFLWKSEETGDFSGVVGVDVEEDVVLLRLIALNPSYRNEGLSIEMIDQVAKKFPNYALVGTLETTPLIQNWQETHFKAEE